MDRVRTALLTAVKLLPILGAGMVRRFINPRNAILCSIVATATLLAFYGLRLYGQEKESGGDIIPLRQVSDPYPVFNGIAIDPANNLVAMTDVNRKSLLSYPRSADSKNGEITPPQRQIFGPLTNVGLRRRESAGSPAKRNPSAQ